MFNVNEIVKVKTTVPTGPVLNRMLNPDGTISYLVEWVDEKGAKQQRWFAEGSLEAM